MAVCSFSAILAGTTCGQRTFCATTCLAAAAAAVCLQDLVVLDVLPQMVALSEAYFQVYQCQQPQPLPGSAKPKQQQQQGKAVKAKPAAAAAGQPS
jgi:hypothetical protein